jgi:hypothetical protein
MDVVAAGALLLGHAMWQVMRWETDAQLQVALGVALAAAAGPLPVQVPRSRHPGAAAEVFVVGLWLLPGPSAAVLEAAAGAGSAIRTAKTHGRAGLAQPLILNPAVPRP